MRSSSRAIEILDDGPGVEVDVLERIFDPFVTKKPSENTTGLGLSVCRDIVERLGGLAHRHERARLGDDDACCVAARARAAFVGRGAPHADHRSHNEEVR
jgi:K+-sensing histidine kinase KdpD